MDIDVLVNQILQVFIIMSLGYFIYKIKLIDADFVKKLTALLMNVIIPALMIGSVTGDRPDTSNDMVLKMLGYSFAVQLFLLVPAFITVKILFVRPRNVGVYMFATLFSNVGFMGFPMSKALYGDVGLLYTVIFNVVFNVVLFMIGAALMSIGEDKPEGVEDRKPRFDFKRLITPGMICSVAAMVIYLAKIPFPSVVCDSIDSVGSITTPLALIIVGANLAKVKVSKLLGSFRAYPFAVIKQLVIPVAMYPLLKLFVSDSVMLGIFVLLVAMPVANNTVLFATTYDKDEELASILVFVTTIICLATMPAVVMITGI